MKRISFCDQWTCGGRPVTLPHDAMLHGDRSADAPSGSGGAFFPGGRYRYEKRFSRPQAEHVLLQFEGVYKNARVYLNDRLAGGTAYGYLPFFIDADPFLVDGENVIRVDCENLDQPDSRWYSGAGIYRPVWLWTGPSGSIAPESIRVSTVSLDPAVIRVESREEICFTVEGISGRGTDFTLSIPDARLWSEDSPALYTARVTNGFDEAEVSFGIRKISWSTKGLFVNGRETLLRGGCLHHDHGILGAATYDESEFRRVKKLKDAGFNAIRSAHNPCSRALLDACDRLGMYVMDEGWDMWYSHKNPYDYASCWRDNCTSDLEAMVQRDFNHPSVLMYSIGNEVTEPGRDEGVQTAKALVDTLHRLDPTRPVTAGINLVILVGSALGKSFYDEDGGAENAIPGAGDVGMDSTKFNEIAATVGSGMNQGAVGEEADRITSPVLDVLDIAGYNYASGRYRLEKEAHPDRVVVGSETFPQDLPQNWAMVRELPYLIGDFMWTAWDYLGEAGIGAWAYTPDGAGFNKPYPWLLADTGAYDILGNPTGELFWAGAVWGRLDKPMICVQPVNHDVTPAKAAWRGTNAIPGWAWQGCEGRRATVEVYTDAARVELLLNGSSVAGKAVEDCRAVFEVPYAPGTLTAVSYDAQGNVLGRSVLCSARGALHVGMHPEVQEARPGQIVYVPVTIEDADGTVERNADRRLSIRVENGTLLGFGSADPRTEERYDSGVFTTYYGQALAVVRAGEAGELLLHAEDAGIAIPVRERA